LLKYLAGDWMAAIEGVSLRFGVPKTLSPSGAFDLGMIKSSIIIINK